MKESNEKKLKSFTTGLAIGGILAGGGVYAATVSASNVSYNNSTTGINSSNVQGAIDSLKVKVNGLKHENERYTHVRYFYHCHSYEINGNQWGTCGNSSIYGVSTDANGMDYVQFQVNLGSKTSTSLFVERALYSATYLIFFKRSGSRRMVNLGKFDAIISPFYYCNKFIIAL